MHLLYISGTITTPFNIEPTSFGDITVRDGKKLLQWFTIYDFCLKSYLPLMTVCEIRTLQTAYGRDDCLNRQCCICIDASSAFVPVSLAAAPDNSTHPPPFLLVLFPLTKEKDSYVDFV